MRLLIPHTAIILLFIISFGTAPLYPDDEFSSLYFNLYLQEKDIKEEKALEKIYLKNNALYCTGESKAASENNRAADLMQEGNFPEAAEVLEGALRQAPLFVPFRYNLGICEIHLNRLKMAMQHLRRVEAMVPEFYRVYLQTGYIYKRWNRINDAIDEYRKAVRFNPKELNAFVSIGDIYFERNQMEAAGKYYDAALNIDQFFPNGLLGNAKIHFKKEEFIKTIVLLKSIDITKDYDKSLHFYYAESSFRLRDYKTAASQYEMLLKYRNDRFFLSYSAGLIEHKMEMARRFVDR